MNIVIRSYLSGSYLLEREPNKWDAIIILDSGIKHTDFVASHARNHVYLRFDDVDTGIRGKRPPTIDDIRLALEFAAQSDNVLVCCRAGQARSAAMAFLISYQRLGPDTATRLLHPQRHRPNSLIIDLGARVIQDASLIPTFHKWESDNRNTTMSDYYDDIEREINELERQGARDRIVDS